MTTTTTRKLREGTRMIVLAVLLLALGIILSSCGTMPRQDGMGVRASIGAGASHVKGEVRLPGGDKEHESATGTNYGARVEVFRRPDYIENTSVGVRLQTSARDVSETGLGASGDGKLDLEVYGAEIHGVIRHYFPTSGTVRPFVEVFGGVGYNDGDLTASGGGLLTPISRSANDWSAVGGGGLGIEFDVSNDFSLFIMGDYSIRFNDADPFKFRSQDATLWIGGEISF